MFDMRVMPPYINCITVLYNYHETALTGALEFGTPTFLGQYNYAYWF